MDAEKVLAVLRRFEWGDKVDDEVCCPECRLDRDSYDNAGERYTRNEHREDCKLAKLIAAAEEEIEDLSTVGLNTYCSFCRYSVNNPKLSGATGVVFHGVTVCNECMPYAEAFANSLKAADAEWKPGTEPPSDIRDIIVCEFTDLDLNDNCEPLRTGYYASADQEYVVADDGGIVRVRPNKVQWHELPPLPEQTA